MLHTWGGTLSAIGGAMDEDMLLVWPFGTGLRGYQALIGVRMQIVSCETWICKIQSTATRDWLRRLRRYGRIESPGHHKRLLSTLNLIFPIPLKLKRQRAQSTAQW